MDHICRDNSMIKHNGNGNGGGGGGDVVVM